MKYKLEIPEKYVGVVTNTLRGHNGQTLKMWDDLVHDTGWLVEVKESMTAEEAFDAFYKDYGTDKPPSIRDWINGWAQGRENLLLEQENENSNT